MAAATLAAEITEATDDWLSTSGAHARAARPTLPGAGPRRASRLLSAVHQPVRRGARRGSERLAGAGWRDGLDGDVRRYVGGALGDQPAHRAGAQHRLAAAAPAAARARAVRPHGAPDRGGGAGRSFA